MRYEDVHGKVITIVDPNKRPVRARVVGYTGAGQGGGVSFRFLDGEETGWHLSSDNANEYMLRKQGWEIPEITVTNVRDQELQRLASRFLPKPPPTDSLGSMEGVRESSRTLTQKQRRELAASRKQQPGDPHPEHTTHFREHPDLQIPPEALAVIEKQWPEVVRTFEQYDQASGMLMLYGTVRDACKAAGWPDSKAYLMRDYLIDKMNKGKHRTYTGGDDRRGEFKTFKMKAQKAVESLLEDDIPGGSAAGDRNDRSGFDPEELAIGIRVEMEHTTSRRVAEEIALDHLSEDPHYYSKLKRAGMDESAEERLVKKQERAFQMANRHNPYPRTAGKAQRRFKKWSHAGQKAQDQMMRVLGTKD